MYLLSILKAQGRDRKGGLMKDPTLTMPAYRRNHYQDPKFQQQYMCLGHKISTLRTSMGISQRQLTDVVGISRSYLSKLECGYGISGVSIEVVFKIAYCLNISTSQLLHLRMQDYKSCNRHLSKHYERVEFFRRAHQRFLELKKRL